MVIWKLSSKDSVIFCQGQLWAFVSVLCINSCFFKSDNVLLFLPHFEHSWDCSSPVCVFRCLFKRLDSLKVISHILHLWGLASECMTSWNFNSVELIKRRVAFESVRRQDVLILGLQNYLFASKNFWRYCLLKESRQGITN